MNFFVLKCLKFFLLTSFILYIQTQPYGFLTNITSTSAYLFVYVFSPFLSLLYFIKINYNNLLQTFNNGSNFALTNSLAFYHPLLLFVSLKFFSKTLKKLNTLEHYSKQNNYIVITILLGAWWSSQELLWGGFWNWDFVEVTLMYLLFISLIYSHNKNYIIKYNMYLKHFFVVLTLYIIVNRTPIISSQHAFATSLFFKYNIIYVIGLTFILNLLINTKTAFVLKKLNSFVDTLKFIIIFLFIAGISKQIFNVNYTLPSILKLFFKFVIITYFLQTNLWVYIFYKHIFPMTACIIILTYYKQPPVKKKKILHNFYSLALLYSVVFFLSKNCKTQKIFFLENKFFFKKIEFFFQKITCNHNIFYKKCVKFVVNFKTNILGSSYQFKSFILNYKQPQTYNLNFGFNVVLYYYFSKLIKYLKQKLVSISVFKQT